MLKQFVEQLSIDFGYQQPLAANDDGSYSLSLEPDLDISLREISDSCIAFYAPVASFPSSNSEEFLLRLMSANLFGRETGGSCLGLDSDGKKVVLLNFLSGASNYRIFHDCLEDFVNYADVWRQEIVEWAAGNQ